MRRDVALAELTTLGLGGRARYFIEAANETDVRAAIRWADGENLRTFVIGGGSNVVIPDDGIDGLVLRMSSAGLWTEGGMTPGAEPGGDVLLVAEAGVAWDRVVVHAVERDLAGIECLSGIPGTAGATPIQNVGAYGQEIADTLAWVRVLDRQTMTARRLPAEACELGYRDSMLRRQPDRYVVLAIGLLLQAGGRPTIRYPELAVALDMEHRLPPEEGSGERASDRPSAPTGTPPRRLSEAPTPRESAARDSARPDGFDPDAPRPGPSLAEVRDAVLALRAEKSMVLDDRDPNRRSVGSFFKNPIVSAAAAAKIREGAADATAPGDDMPSWPVGDGVKLSAAWMIEKAGFTKGMRRGAVGISSNHALALVHHGGGSSAALLAFADEIGAAVRDRFGIDLEREPVCLSQAH